MSQDALYVDEVLVDLPPRFRFALTITAFDPGAVDTRDVDFTNTVKLQWTPTNQVVFGFAWNQKSGSRIPYRRLTARLLQEGAETMSDGRCWVKDADESGVTIAIYENVLNVFDAIAGLKLDQLAHIAISGWDAAGIDTARLATSGVVAAVLNWGRAGAIYQVDYFLPSFFYHDMITTMLARTGLALSGAILTDAKLKDLVIPYSRPKFEYPIGQGELYQLIAPLMFVNYEFQNLFVTDGATAFPATPNLPAIGTSTAWEVQGDEIVLKDSGHGSARWLTLQAVAALGININITAWTPGALLRVYLEVYHPTLGYSYVQTYEWDDNTLSGGLGIPGYYGSTTFLPLAAYNMVLADGTRIRAYVDAAGSTAGTTVTPGFGACQAGAIQATITTTVDRAAVNWMALVPDMLMSAMLKDFTIRYGAIYKQVAGTLYIKTIEEIANDRGNAQDWSGKRVVTPKEAISYANKYAQRNTMKYQDQADDPDLGLGAFLLDNDSLQQEKNIYSSPFGNAKTATYSGGSKALVNVYEGATTGITDFENDPGLRLLTLRAKDAGEGNITFNAIARGDYKVAYFVDGLKTKDTGFQYFLNQQYPQLAGALDEFKEPTHYYDLSQDDIKAFDKHRPMYDGGAYYIVLKIATFIPGQVTRVDVLKLK